MADDKTPNPKPTPAAGEASSDVAAEAQRALADVEAAADQIDAQTQGEPAATAKGPDPNAPNFDLPAFQQLMAEADAAGIELLRDVELNVKIELGRTDMLVEDVLALAEGSVVELNKLAGDPVDVYVNERLVARGEVLVLSENFCVRINEIVSQNPQTEDDAQAPAPKPAEAAAES